MADYRDTGAELTVLDRGGFAKNLATVTGIDRTGATSSAAALETLTAGYYHVGPGTYLVDASVTIPAGVVLEMAAGALFSVSSGFTLTIAGDVRAGRSEHFGGAGRVVFSSASPTDTMLPEWWGAVGDAVTDDISALRGMVRAINTRGSGVVSFAHGSTYVYSNELNDDSEDETLNFENLSSLLILGYGATIKTADDGCTILTARSWGQLNFYECERVEILGLTFDGNRNAQTHTTAPDEGANHGITWYQGGDTLIVRDCFFKWHGTLRPSFDVRGDALYVRPGLKNLVVENCKFRYVGRWCLAFTNNTASALYDGTESVIFRNNDCQLPIRGTTDGVHLGAVDLETNNGYNGVVISGNKFSGSANVTLAGGSSTAGDMEMNGIRISDNTFDFRGGSSIYDTGIVFAGPTAPSTKSLRDVEILNNTILFDHAPTTMIDLCRSQMRIENLRVEGNYCKTTTTTTSQHAGIRINHGGNLEGDISIKGNTVIGAGSAIQAELFGTLVDEPVFHMVIEGNDFRACYRPLRLQFQTITHTNAAQNTCVIRNNYARSNGAGGVQVFGGSIIAEIHEGDQMEGVPNSTNQTNVRYMGGPVASTTANRPTSPRTGQAFFDTTLGKPVWYNGSVWKDATGTTV